MRSSLRTTLLCWLGVPLLLLLPVTAFVQYRLALIPAAEVLDHEIGNVTLALAPHVHTTERGVAFDINPDVDATLRSDEMDSILYAVLDPAGNAIAGERVLADEKVTLQPGEVRMYDTRVSNFRVRVAARGVACGKGVCQVRAAETSVNRSQIETRVLGTTLAAMMVLAAIAMIGLLSAIHGGLKRLTKLSDQLATRSLDDLRPLDASAVPREMSSIVDAMNRLFERLRSASVAQQAFLADAAHQLRTPLATLRTETELAILEPHSADMHPLLVRLQEAAARAARLSSQLLALARSDPSAAAAVAMEPVNLKDVGSEAAREWVPAAIAADADIGFELSDATIVGRQFQMREALNNLIHNALEYGGRGVRITVRTFARDGEAVLEVEDNGPGIPEAERDKVVQRFYRPAGSRGNGSGLGLAIVRDIAASKDATLAIETPPAGRGTLVRLVFPLADPVRGAADASTEQGTRDPASTPAHV